MENGKYFLKEKIYIIFKDEKGMLVLSFTLFSSA